jgi:SpoVK/Ycf46/Vps4 family AAA+-type ATPase
VAITADHVKALIKRHMDGDEEGFYAVARQVAARAAREGKNVFASDLKELIDSATSRSAAPQARTVPLQQPRGELAGLMSVAYPDIGLAAMTLTNDIRGRLERAVTEQRRAGELIEKGLTPIHRLLLLGPPGTGKSMTASALAFELKLPLFTIQLDVLISKYMGETAAKLRLVFDAIADTRGVFLFDEFDALGAQRTATNDVGEVRRVLNSFLQFLEHASPHSLIVAATNHPKLLDAALNRRFDLVVEYAMPDEADALDVVKRRLSSLDTRGVQWESIAQHTKDLSHAELVRAAEAAAKQSVLAGRKRLSTAALIESLRERRRIVYD